MNGDSQPATKVSDATNGSSSHPAPLTSAVGEQSTSEESGSHEARNSSKRERLRGLGSRTKTKAKRLLTLDRASEREGAASRDGTTGLSLVQEDPAFNTSKLIKKDSLSVGGAAGKALGALQTVAETVAHPKESLKSKATKTTAGKLSRLERPYISKKADLDFLQAQVNLRDEEASRSSMYDAQGAERISREDDLRETVEQLEAHRWSLRVAWTTSRHVDRVRVVVKKPISFPDREAFLERDADGGVVRFRWEKWLGYVILYHAQDFGAHYIDDFDELPFDPAVLKHHLERVIVASDPWQAWFIDVRSVYRWEDPARTGRWLAVYAVLWYTQHLMAFLWAYIIYIVVKRRFFPSSVQALRESMARALNRGDTAYKFSELIDKHGSEKWLGPLADRLGPHVQLQMNDLANMLEVFSNFYAWSMPNQTVHSLCFIGTLLLIALTADMAFCMKLASLLGGISFFVSWPIASLYPKYRYLVSPVKWVFWGIPTDAESSFKYLRHQAEEAREGLLKRSNHEGLADRTKNPSGNTYFDEILRTNSRSAGFGEEELACSIASDDAGEDGWQTVDSGGDNVDEEVIAFRAKWKHHVGRLVVSTSGIRFVRALSKRELWRRSFPELVEMRKVHGSRMSKLTMKATQQVEFACRDGTTLRIEGMLNRDQAFNTIIGFSGLQWQVLQMGPGKHGKGSLSRKHD